ncbi:tRNA isopentenyl-2-thiomethyl-A-37 hydroxylase MiaE [Pseudomonas abyssi]|uniref:tRNA isopentenyl-2-thiomethyl-A-37 hydroxylase MiaE n=1 Tax=Pseudomonas abyssi TaxID=170540 RepID=UPI003C7BCA4B
MLPDELLAFLPCRTPDAWIEQALAHPQELLIDHANCEKLSAFLQNTLVILHD